MKCILIDYGTPDPRAVKAGTRASERRGKFIQVRNGDTEYLALSPKALAAYHANIAERFFSEMGITGSYNRKRDSYRVKSPGWSIVGGGHFALDEERRELHLSGTSMAYGRFDPAGLRERLYTSGILPGYRIIVTYEEET
jgi:hypothetical protein